MKNLKLAKNTKLFLSITGIIYFLFFILFVIFFRTIRDILPNPKIDSSTIVGYSQYFGYPFFLDSAIFAAAIISPFIIAFVLKHNKFKK